MKKTMLLGVFIVAITSMSFATNTDSKHKRVSKEVVNSIQAPDFLETYNGSIEAVIEFSILENGRAYLVNSTSKNDQLNSYLENQIRKLKFKKNQFDGSVIHKIKYSYNGNKFF